MLLVALFDCERVDAIKHSTESWAVLKASKERERLVMPLCGIRAIAKTRGAATQFFAHHTVAECDVEHGGETVQHLAMKEALAGCIDAVPGWHAVVEFAHPSREWIVPPPEAHSRPTVPSAIGQRTEPASKGDSI